MGRSEGNSLWDPEVLASFSDVLKQYKLQGHQEDYDEFDIVREFRATAATKARSVLTKPVQTTGEFEDWDLEVKLWDLVENLLRYRYSEKPSQITAREFNSDIVFEEQFLNNDPSLYEIWIIIMWIQNNALELERPKNLATTKWFNTQLQNTLDSFDSDAPIRQDQSIDPRDQEQDSVFYRYIFDLLLAGKYKEASAECESTKNWTLKMILAGANNYLDPVIDKEIDNSIDESTHGTKNKALWRRTVYLLSKNEKIPQYESAIYGYLAGDISSPLELSTTWDSDMLIYLNHIFTNQMEHKLVDSGRISKEDIIMAFPRTDLSIQKVLNSVASKRPEESEHPLRVLVASVISNNIAAIIHSSLALVGNVMLGKQNSNEIMNEPYLLRVVTHLAIFISIIDPSIIDVESRSKLVTTYILLLRLYGQYDQIPLYVSFLPELEIRNAYSLFLIDLYDAQARPKQLELSRLYKLPLENILKRTVERAFAVTEPHYQIKSGVTLQSIDDSDLQLIRGVEWFIEANMFSDAIHAALALFRRFLLVGRAKAAQEFATRNSIPLLLKHYDVESMGALVEQEVDDFEREELLQYHSLILALNAIDEWRSTSQRISSSSSSYAFIDTITRVTTTVKDTIGSLFLDLSHVEYKKELINDLRSLYIPYLIIELHNVYVEGGSHSASYLSDALDLTNLVASEGTKFYKLLQNCDRLKEYLELVAKCAARAAGKGL